MDGNQHEPQRRLLGRAAADGLRAWSPQEHRARRDLRLAGMVALFALDAPINDERFAAYATHVLVSELRRDDNVIMDNLSNHKRAGMRERFDAPSPG